METKELSPAVENREETQKGFDGGHAHHVSLSEEEKIALIERGYYPVPLSRRRNHPVCDCSSVEEAYIADFHPWWKEDDDDPYVNHVSVRKLTLCTHCHKFLIEEYGWEQVNVPIEE